MPGPLKGRVEPVPKNLFLPALSLPTILRSVIGLFAKIRARFESAPTAALEKPRIMLFVISSSVLINVTGKRTWTALCARLI